MSSVTCVINTKLDLCHKIASFPVLSMLFWDLVSREVAVNHSEEMLILDQNKNCKWRFPKMRDTPKSSIFPIILSIFGYPHLWKPPSLCVLQCPVGQTDRPGSYLRCPVQRLFSDRPTTRRCDGPMARWPIWSWQIWKPMACHGKWSTNGGFLHGFSMPYL